MLQVRNLGLGDFTNEEPNLPSKKCKKLSDFAQSDRARKWQGETLMRLSDCNYPHKMINSITFCRE